MNKNVLVEQINSSFQILTDKPANVLKRIKGVVSDNKSNRNGRVYPMSLWQNVVNSDYVKEMINNHSLFGEADHPETRLEISLQNVSHAINDLWIEGDKVLAVIDILPTPMGKIISELLDYGTNIGISSRGAGTVLRDNSVDPDDYQFVTFDFVARPSCEAARLNTILESASIEAKNTKDDEINSLLESYKSELNESTLDNNKLANEMFEIVKKYFECHPHASQANAHVDFDEYNSLKYMFSINSSYRNTDVYYYISMSENNANDKINEFRNETKKLLKSYGFNRVKFNFSVVKNNYTTWERDIQVENRKAIREIYFDKTDKITESEEIWKLEIMVNGELNYSNKLSIKQVGEILEHAEGVKPLPKDFFGDEEGIPFNQEERFDDCEKIKRNDKLTEGRVLDIVEARKLLNDTDAEGLDMVLDDLHGKVDLEKDSLVTIEDLVHDSVYKYNEANSFSEYEDEEFYGREYNARNIYKVILKMYGRDKMSESDLFESIRDSYINDTVKELLN